jgi:hypothetical protein
MVKQPSPDDVSSERFRELVEWILSYNCLSRYGKDAETKLREQIRACSAPSAEFLALVEDGVGMWDAPEYGRALMVLLMDWAKDEAEAEDYEDRDVELITVSYGMVCDLSMLSVSTKVRAMLLLMDWAKAEAEAEDEE